MNRLIREHILACFGGGAGEVPLEALDDSAVIDDVVFTTDAHTVKPIFFPNGDIGRLAVSGTVNDIAVMGAAPVALSAAMVLEEGLPISTLHRVLSSMGATSREAGVPIVTGDTKVVERGAVDGMIITTSAIGKRTSILDGNIEEVKRYRAFDGRWLCDSNVRLGDKIIVSGTVGDHGIALLSSREGYGFESTVKSDVAPLNRMISDALAVGGIAAMKDLTRGGLANALNEWNEKSHTGIRVNESDIPVSDGVASACGMLGIDPLEIGNEGKIILAVVPERADDVLQALRKTETGRMAELIGEACDETGVVMETCMGGRRIIEQPVGDPIPRIC